MPTLTLRMPDYGDDAQRRTVEAAAHDAAGAIVWHVDDRLHLAYGICRYPGAERPAFHDGVTVYDSAIIAMAVRPSLPEAFSSILAALGGDGRPAGVLGAFRVDDSLVLEIDPGVTPATWVMHVLDIELARFRASRVSRLLLPLDTEAVTAVAAAGLATPDIRPERVLEYLLERSGAIS